MFDELIAKLNEETEMQVAAEPKRTKQSYTVEEIQNILEISRASAYRLVHSGQFKVLKVGGQIRIPVSSFEEWLTGAAVLSSM